MDILEQCRKWHENGEYQKIIDALEAIPAEERTPETDMELARACNNLADPSEPEGRKLLHRALKLMQSHEEELRDTYSWTSVWAIPITIWTKKAALCGILKKLWNFIPEMILNLTPNRILRN